MFFQFKIYSCLACIAWLALAGCNRHHPVKAPAPTAFEKRWDSLPYKLENTNAYYIAYIRPDGNMTERWKGERATNGKADRYTLYEGASLSKTLFAYLYWKLVREGKLKGKDGNDIIAPICSSRQVTSIDPRRFLSHTVACGDSCVYKANPDNAFAYSENCYLMMQWFVEGQTGKDLEQLAREEIFIPLGMAQSTFIWHDSFSNYVNGFREDKILQREMYRFKRPQANGTLYTTGHDLVLFVKALVKSPEFDSMCRKIIPVKGFEGLYWGAGIGIEEQKDRTFYWQWGSNWCYNDLLLIDGRDRSALVCLSNSIIGAKRLRQTGNYLLDRQFQLFNYINWY